MADWILKAGAVAIGVEFRFHDVEASSPLILGSVLIVGVLIAGASPRLPRLERLGVGLMLGGSLGNMGEVAVFGHVTDFIPLPPGSLSSPADLCLTMGLAISLLGLFKSVRGDRQRRRARRLAHAS